MKIAIACDHGGYDFKIILAKWLKDNRYEVVDFGTNSKNSCDYPDFGIPAVKSVSINENNLGILICNNGIGMSILANKFKNIKAALVYNNKTAEMTKRHHNSNVLCLGGQEFDNDKLLNFVKIWLTTDFEGGRHERRINKIKDLDKNISATPSI